MSGQARMGGWRRIGLDDDFPIRQALHPLGTRGFALIVGDVGLIFSLEYVYL